MNVSKWLGISKMRCDVCPHHCVLEEGETGLCRARANKGGKSVSLNYARVTSIALDPIEKKPLSRFFPGSMILSVGSFGCNMDCPFCQNHSIAAASADEVRTEHIPPEKLARLAKEAQSRGSIGVAFTYNEPMIGFEYVRDVSLKTKEYGMKNVAVTNGCVLPHVLDEVLPNIDAFNIDLKSFSEQTYKNLGGDLNTVKEFIVGAAQKAHVEVTTLVVPGMNDTEEEMRELAAWLASVNRSIPLHISRFFPRRKMCDLMPTDLKLMRRLRDTASKELDSVILGNV